MIDPLIDSESRAESLHFLYSRLRFSEPCAVVGINDIGKTTLLGMAQQPEIVRRYGSASLQQDRLLAGVDCNLLAGSSERELYAVMARGLADAALRTGRPDMAQEATEYASSHGERASGVLAAMEMEALLVRLVEHGQLSLVFLFDEFDALYRHVDARVALTLRAFHNRLGPALAYVVASDQPLHRLRPGGETAEFDELFVGREYVLEPLAHEQAAALVVRYVESRDVITAPSLPQRISALCGGHPGLLWACCAALHRLPAVSGQHLEQELLTAGEVRAECENVWRRLPADERIAHTAHTIPLLARYAEEHTGVKTGGLAFDASTGEVSVNGAPLPARLGPTEFRLLQSLSERPGALVTKDAIARAVWPEEQRLAGVDDARIDKLIDRVRAKIEPDPKAPRFLVTVRGMGYRLLSGS